jgi:hypothetical protein
MALEGSKQVKKLSTVKPATTSTWKATGTTVAQGTITSKTWENVFARVAAFTPVSET